MPTPVVQRITAWSFSRYKDYAKCPRLAKYKHIDKRKTPDSPAIARGSLIDGAAEAYLTGKAPKPELLPFVKKLHPDLVSFKDEFAALKKKKNLFVQQQWAFNASWDVVDWFARDAWFRVKMDAAYITKLILDLIDFKTGKKYPEHEEQVDSYGLAGFLRFPEVQTIKGRMWYTDLGEEGKEIVFERSELPQLKERWLDNLQPMFNDTRFAPLPGRHCLYCPFSKSKGGPCDF